MVDVELKWPAGTGPEPCLANIHVTLRPSGNSAVLQVDRNFQVAIPQLWMSSRPRPKVAVPRRRPGRAAKSGVTLNLDILRHILLFVEERKDLMAVMLTCHALYDAGIQPFVRLFVTLYEDAICPFHDFMLAHAPATFLAFRELDLAVCGELNADDKGLIAELLKRGTKLRRLELPYMVLEGLGNEEICEAVGHLRELEELDIVDGYYFGIDRILTRSYSPLAKINIQFAFDEYVEEGEPILDPVLLLANFQHTLERATITSFPSSTVDLCYPKLLNLELRLLGGPSLSVLVTAFPNLQTLLIYINSWMEDEELTDLRKRNIALQDGRKCWGSLMSVNADPEALYAMGLKNTFQSVTIATLDDELTSVHLSFLRAVISTTKTEALSLHVRSLDTSCILSTILNDVVNPLVSLELTLQILEGIDHNKTLDDLCQGLSSITAIMFNLKLLRLPNTFRTATLRPVGRYRAEDFFNHLDERILATQIGASMRNVACISLDIAPRKASYWMNTASETETKEWTKAQLDEPATTDGLGRFLGRIISMSSVRN